MRKSILRSRTGGRASTLVTCMVMASAACQSSHREQRGSDSVEQESPAEEMGRAVSAAAPQQAEARWNGPTSPYGADTALGYDPAAALGAMKPDDATGGMGMRHSGKREAAAQSELDQPAAATRSWFPETFLFEPLVVTDDNGSATFSVRVPDRLTSWRVLALAHSRTGAQGGAATSFLGTLPVYVDPIVPKTLVVGDEVLIPIQMVNTTTAAVSTSLVIEATNATITAPKGPRTIAAAGTQVEYAKLRVEHAGEVLLRVTLGQTDAVLRSIRVVPAGRPVSTTKSGTLAAPRTFTLAGTKDADATTDRVRLLAFPGALALLRSELSGALSRTSPADDAYALLLADRAKDLLLALGDQADPAAVRELSLLATQRAVRDGRNLDVPKAALLSQAALTQTDNPVLQRLGQRAADFLAQNQLPDGTFKGPNGRTVQHMLVVTAEAIRAVACATETTADQHRATAMSARALGTFAQNLVHVEDGYTAAAILATGTISGQLAEDLRLRVLSSIKTAADGAKYLDVAEGVVRADGATPSRSEATAMAVLALADDPKAPLPDLGATLLGSYTLERGWGDGRANMLGMLAVIQLFKEPVPSDVRITLLMDDKPVLEGLLERQKLHHVVTLEGLTPGLAESHEWKVVADPPVPGLGYALTLESWVPWAKASAKEGVELSLPEAVNTMVGVATPVTLTAVAPAGLALHIRHALPTGVQVDTASLEELVLAGTITKFTVVDGAVDLYASNATPGQLFSATYRVVATFAGSLLSRASLIEAGGRSFDVPPARWIIRSAGLAAR